MEEALKGKTVYRPALLFDLDGKESVGTVAYVVLSEKGGKLLLDDERWVPKAILFLTEEEAIAYGQSLIDLKDSYELEDSPIS